MITNATQKDIISQLIEAFDSPTGLAIGLGVTTQRLNNWINRGFPKESLILIETKARERGLEISVYDLLAYNPKDAA